MLFLMITQVPLFVKKNVKNNSRPLRACCTIINILPCFFIIVKRGGVGFKENRDIEGQALLPRGGFPLIGAVFQAGLSRSRLRPTWFLFLMLPYIERIWHGILKIDSRAPQAYSPELLFLI
jgi:hypothetical protein